MGVRQNRLTDGLERHKLRSLLLQGPPLELLVGQDVLDVEERRL